MGEHIESADIEQLILFPSGYDLRVANLPVGGRYLAEIIYLPPDLIERFKQRYPSAATEAKEARFCVPLNAELLYCWEHMSSAIQQKLSPPLLEHAIQGVLLSLKNAGWIDILLQERFDSTLSRCQKLLMLDPAASWTAEKAAQKLHVAASTLRRRLAAEKSSFREILDDIRLGNALNAIQTTNAPIGEIARENGYLCPSRFTARFHKRFHITPRALRQTMKNSQPKAEVIME